MCVQLIWTVQAPGIESLIGFGIEILKSLDSPMGV
jgi:hypothetical protein